MMLLAVFAGTLTMGQLSEKTCAELGWTDNIKTGAGAYDGGLGVEGVCGTEDDAICKSALKWGPSVSLCTDIGARLCTEDEYAALEAGNSGCNMEKKGRYVWTSSECTKGGERMSIKLDEAGKVTKKCREENSKAYGGRCCADMGEPVVTEAPTMAPVTITEAPTPDSSLSEKTCAEMGWSDEVVTGGLGVEGVCGTKGEETVCTEEVLLGDAEAICTDMGTRLCTQLEYESLEAFDSGCKYEKKNKFVWTSTECTEDGGDKNPGHITVKLSKTGSATSTCTAFGGRANGGRCCADVGEVTETDAPTMAPISTDAPTPVPTMEPTFEPTMTEAPTPEPTMTDAPTMEPTMTDAPTMEPTMTEAPTSAAPTTMTPSMMPTEKPTEDPDSIDYIMAELMCIAASDSKKNCKAALPKVVGKCKWHKGGQVEDRCQIKKFYGEQ